MSLLALDTFEAVKELRDLGMDEKQARAIVKIVSSSAEAHVANLATKDELKTEAAEIRNEIANVRIEIAEVKADLIKWMIGSQVVLLGALVALIRFADILG